LKIKNINLYISIYVNKQWWQHNQYTAAKSQMDKLVQNTYNPGTPKGQKGHQEHRYDC